MFAQEETELACASTPMEDAYLLDPFFGNSRALLNILRENGYDMPEDYLENLDNNGNYIGRNREYNKAATPTQKEIPIKAWIYRNDNGTGNISTSTLNAIVDYLNILFSTNTNISFYLLCEISTINNSNIANNGDVYFSDYTLNNKVSGALNLHFVISANGEWSGKANFPFNQLSQRRFSCAITYFPVSSMAAIAAHEIGHTLGLYHTHHPGRSWSHSNNGYCGDCYQESVSRTRRQEIGCVSTYDKLKCDVNGDFLCDTAADPELSSALVGGSACDYNSTNTDNWGDIWTPNENNIMSYSSLSCLNYFSPLQIGKMNYYYSQIGINQPFYSINGSSYICNGQTAFYNIVNIPGVNYYTWETSSNLTITSGQGTNAITIQANNNDGGYVKVVPECGNRSKSKPIHKFYDLEIDGYDTACAQNGFSYNYTIPALYGGSYFWSITNGSINYGQGTNSVNISLSAHPSNQTTLSLQITGVCTSTIYKYKIITHGDPPPPAEQCFSHSQNEKSLDSPLLTNEDVILYPNPTTDYFSIILPYNGDYEIFILKNNGQILNKEKITQGNQITLNVENYQSGIYFISIKNKNNTIIKNLIIKK